jgi:hypothetical protein
VPIIRDPSALRRPETRRTVALALTGGLSVVIFVLALIPLPQATNLPGNDKLHHLIAFAALTLPCAVFYPRALIWVLPVIVAQAGLIEIVQPYVNRMREWADFVADLKGIAIGLGLGLGLHGVRQLAARRSGRAS